MAAAVERVAAAMVAAARAAAVRVTCGRQSHMARAQGWRAHCGRKREGHAVELLQRNIIRFVAVIELHREQHLAVGLLDLRDVAEMQPAVIKNDAHALAELKAT